MGIVLSVLAGVFYALGMSILVVALIMTFDLAATFMQGEYEDDLTKRKD
jgi:hypothetical protein